MDALLTGSNLNPRAGVWITRKTPFLIHDPKQELASAGKELELIRTHAIVKHYRDLQSLPTIGKVRKLIRRLRRRIASTD